MPSPVEEIKAKLDIADVISSYIPLNQVGANLKTKCPFHNEKTPSFIVSKEKQIWHCFGCGKGGDLISFVQEYEGLTFPEALKLLAKRANVTLPEYRGEPKENYSKFYDLNQAAADFYHQKLQSSEAIAVKVREYLFNRKINKEAIVKWQLGLSGDNWDELHIYLKDRSFLDQDIFQAGLILKKKQGNGFIDRFRKRLMFPIFDQQGRVVAFTSRTLAKIAYEEDDEGGKYINSPQTVIYDKSKILYGWHLAKVNVRQKKYLIIVEGNTDVIAAHNVGTTNTVAVSGTALTIDQIKLIKRHTNNIILAFDGDKAGSKAAFRGISLGWQEDMNIKILILPKGKDPADVIKEDKQVWLAAIKNSIPVMDFYFQKVMNAIDITRADHKKLAVRKLLPIIKFLQSSVEQIHYLQMLSDKLNIPLSLLQEDLRNAKSFLESQTTVTQTEAVITPPKDFLLALSEQALAIAFYKDNFLIRFIADVEPEMVVGDLQSLYKQVIIYYTKHQSLKDFLDYPELTKEEKQTWVKLALLAEKDYIDLVDKDLDQHFQSLLNSLKKQYFIVQRQNFIRQLQQAEINKDPIEQDKITHQINLLNKEIHNLQ